jgi:hypothetical protein
MNERICEREQKHIVSKASTVHQLQVQILPSLPFLIFESLNTPRGDVQTPGRVQIMGEKGRHPDFGRGK